MAYFFRTHQCNALCARLGLPPFARCDSDVRSQGYSADNSLMAGTAIAPGRSSRTLIRQTSSLRARLRALLKVPSKATTSSMKSFSCEHLLGLLDEVPEVDTSEALVHMEVARLYAECVILPDLRPDQDPDDARQVCENPIRMCSCQVITATSLGHPHRAPVYVSVRLGMTHPSGQHMHHAAYVQQGYTSAAVQFDFY